MFYRAMIYFCHVNSWRGPLNITPLLVVKPARLQYSHCRRSFNLTGLRDPDLRCEATKPEVPRQFQPGAYARSRCARGAATVKGFKLKQLIAGPADGA